MQNRRVRPGTKAMAEDETFLERWSRRKRTDGSEPDAEKQGLAPDEAEATDGAASGQGPDAESGEAAEGPAPWQDIEIDKLDHESDFSAFMQEGVPDDVRKEALDKLWTTDPMANITDGLNDYDEDYSKWGMVKEVIKSAYQAGRGYETEDDDGGDTEDAGTKTVAEADVAPEDTEGTGDAGAETTAEADAAPDDKAADKDGGPTPDDSA